MEFFLRCGGYAFTPVKKFCDIARKLPVVLFGLLVCLLIGTVFLFFPRNEGTLFPQQPLSAISALAELPSCHGCNLVIISVDTLRADHMGFYGYDRNTTAELDEFFRHTSAFLRASPTSDATASSHMSMFTSLFPSTHGVLSQDSSITQLSSRHRTIAEILRQQGYRTQGFHGGGYVSSDFGFDRGFDNYEYDDFVRNSSTVLSWLKRAEPGPFFLFLHTYHTHSPYLPLPQFSSYYDPEYNGRITSRAEELLAADSRIVDGSPMRSLEQYSLIHRRFWSRVDLNSPLDIRHLIALYDSTINGVSFSLAPILAALKDILGRTIVVFTSDHGEEFAEHGGFEHKQLYEEVTHVPLLFYHPRLSNHIEIEERISLVDLTPTILQMLGLGLDENFQGKPFRYVDGSEEAHPSDIYIEGLERNHLAVIADEKKLIVRLRGSASSECKRSIVDLILSGNPKDSPCLRVELYDLTQDPREDEDLSTDRESVAALIEKLRIHLISTQEHSRRYSGTANRDAVPKVSQDTLNRLKGLGYL